MEGLRAEASVLGEEQVGAWGGAGAPGTSGVQLELWRVLGAGAGERPGREVKVFEDAGGDDGVEDAGHHPARWRTPSSTFFLGNMVANQDTLPRWIPGGELGPERQASETSVPHLEAADR